MIVCINVYQLATDILFFTIHNDNYLLCMYNVTEKVQIKTI